MSRMLKKAWRPLVALAAAAVAVVGTATNTQAQPSGFTPEHYNQIQFGMTVEQALAAGGGPQSCWATESSLECFAKDPLNGPHASFEFTRAGQLSRKWHEGIFEVKTPSITLAQYDKVAVGMTEEQLWLAVSKDSCVLKGEAYPFYPSKQRYEREYMCAAEPGPHAPRAWFWFTNGALTDKHKSILT
ncbi:BLIP family protein [Streptomyces jumonjinensis]|uniref:BLIP family protein n=2 Tax=Streptomyces jumonjinensis TaxID=1945 RepID=A0A646KE20_STRJU|nr:BLIP family protein [Streptomyces jumonjinensis]